jgi:hypothetical protein
VPWSPIVVSIMYTYSPTQPTQRCDFTKGVQCLTLPRIYHTSYHLSVGNGNGNNDLLSRIRRIGDP